MGHLNTTEELQVKTEKKSAGILWFLVTETIEEYLLTTILLASGQLQMSQMAIFYLYKQRCYLEFLGTKWVCTSTELHPIWGVLSKNKSGIGSLT